MKHSKKHLIGGKSRAYGTLSYIACAERKCGSVLRALALTSGDPRFKTCSDHLLNLFLVQLPSCTCK